MERLRRIHETSQRILQEIGIRLFHSEVLDVVRDKGIRVLGNTAFFQPEQLMEWVSKAPREFTLYARNPKYNMVIGGDQIECAAGYGCSTIIEADGTRRDSLLSDYITFSKLIHQSDYFDINGGILAQPCDVDPDRSHLIMLYSAVTHSDKSLMGIPCPGKKMQEVMDMMAALFGGKDALMEKPRILTMISPISPLQIDETGLQSILVSARYHQPLIISPCPTAGTTGPINMAGNVALATAEALASIAISQMIEAGTPVIFGLQSNGADLRTGNISIGSPAYALQAGYCAGLARLYGLPSRGGGTTNDAKAVSVQSGYESMMSMLTAFQNRINLIVHSAGILDSFAGMSYEQFIVDLEIISMIKFYLKDIEVDDETLSFDLIKQIGPGGQFLTTEDTLRKCRTHSWNPEISLRGTVTGKAPSDMLLERIHKKLRNMLDSYQKPEMDAAIQKELDEYLIRAGVYPSVIEIITRA